MAVNRTSYVNFNNYYFQSQNRCATMAVGEEGGSGLFGSAPEDKSAFEPAAGDSQAVIELKRAALRISSLLGKNTLKNISYGSSNDSGEQNSTIDPVTGQSRAIAELLKASSRISSLVGKNTLKNISYGSENDRTAQNSAIDPVTGQSRAIAELLKASNRISSLAGKRVNLPVVQPKPKVTTPPSEYEIGIETQMDEIILQRLSKWDMYENLVGGNPTEEQLTIMQETDNKLSNEYETCQRALNTLRMQRGASPYEPSHSEARGELLAAKTHAQEDISMYQDLIATFTKEISSSGPGAEYYIKDLAVAERNLECAKQKIAFLQSYGI